MGTVGAVEYDVEVRVDPARRASIGHLLAEVGRAERRPALSDHLLLDLRDGGGEGFVAVVASADASSDPIAYAQASRANDGHVVEMVIGSAARPHVATIARGLLDRVTRAVAGSGGESLNWWIHGDAALARVAEGSGFVETRRLHQMRMPLPAERSADVVTRAFVVGQDEESWVEVNNRAFAGHGEQGGWTTATLRLREAEPWFDPEGFRIHDRDGRMAAFCWTKVHDPTEYEPDRIGEIYVIAVDPDFHGLGLGPQLTLAGLDHLAALGITTASLYVDAGNTTAVTMYERLGYRIHSTSVMYHAEIPPAAVRPFATRSPTRSPTRSEHDR